MAKFSMINPKYKIIAVIFNAIILFTLPIIIIVNQMIWQGIFFLTIGVILYFFSVIHQCYIKNIEISSNGVTYSTLFKKMEMSWDDIGIIGIGYVPIKAPGRKPWIYFSRDQVTISTLTPRLVSERFFMMNYRQNVIDEIKKHWQGEIVGLNRI